MVGVTASCGVSAVRAAAAAITTHEDDYGTSTLNSSRRRTAAALENEDEEADAILPMEAYPSSTDDDDEEEEEEEEEEEDFDDDESENLRVLKSSWEGDLPMQSLSVPTTMSCRNFSNGGRAASNQHQHYQHYNHHSTTTNNNYFSSIDLPAPAATFTNSTGSDCLNNNNNDNIPSATTTTTTNTNTALDTVAVPRPAPSWQDLSQHVLPTAARELLTASVRRFWYGARWSYAASQWHRRYSDYGSPSVGYYNTLGNKSATMEQAQQSQQPQPPSIPAFSSLPWVERQMVREWRTYLPNEDGHNHQNHLEENQQQQQLDTTSSLDELMIVADDNDDDDDDGDDDKDEENDSDIDCVVEEDDYCDEHEFDRARTLVPVPRPRPVWRHADNCQHCRKPFGPTLLRHHCRLCGGSFCQTHSSHTHPLPHIQDYSMGVPERVCDACKAALLEQNWAERVAWRRARCRDYLEGDSLQPYFDVGLDRMEDAALRITHAALAMAKSLPLGAQATVAVETVDVLRKYGLSGIYTLVLRQEFLAAADLLLKALGINRTAWPLSVHELSAAIFYALAQHRALRGLHPDREHELHAVREASTDNNNNNNNNANENLETVAAESDDAKESDDPDSAESNTRAAVCDSVPDEELQSLIFFAPIALHFIYVEKEVDMQLLAAQQGWRLVYAYLNPAQQDGGIPIGGEIHDRPASALFVHQEQRIACVAVRGTSTIHDVITDIRQVPVPFPDPESVSSSSKSNKNGNESGTAGGDDEWTTVFRGQGLAVAGMAAAAVNLYQEHVDSLLLLAKEGYQIRLVGHSLGGSVATLLGVLIYKDLVEMAERDTVDPSSANIPQKVPLHVYSFGTPSCVDLPLSEAVESFVTTVVLHDDVVPRLTPTSCRGLLKHLLHIRETWVKQHFADDIRAFTDRAKLAWAPRWRGGFTLSATSPSIKLKRYCRKQLQYGKKQLLYGKDQLMSVKDKLVGDENGTGFTASGRVIDHEDDFPERVDWRHGASSLTTEAAQRADEASSTVVEAEPKLIMDFMGGIDVRTEGIVIDGEEFFDPGPDLLDSSENDDDSATTNAIFDSSLAGSPGDADRNEEVLLDDVKAFTSYDAVDDSLSADSIEKTVEIDDDDAPGAVVLEETPLPRMFIPGKIVHIYSHRGVYRAAYVPRMFRELRRISLAGNMLSDHKTKSYFDALLEVKSVRDAKEDPPQWTAFDEDDTW